MATIRQIAESLNISPSTVSKALNNATDISDSLRQAVLEKAAELGYATKSSHRKSNRKLAILIKNMAYTTPKDFGYNIIVGFRKQAMAYDWNVEIFEITREIQEKEKYDIFLLRRGLSGGFCLGFTLRDPWMKQFEETQAATVLLDNFIRSNPRVACIGTDSYEGIDEAVAHLASLGHRKISYFGGEEHSRISQERLDAFERSMADRGLKVRHDLILADDYLTPSIAGALIPAFEAQATAFVCANDIIAAGIIEECKRFGIRVPEDISVIGFDDIPLAEITDPPLTTVQQNLKYIGMFAVSVLAELNGNMHLSTLTVRPKLIVRKSTAPANEEGYSFSCPDAAAENEAAAY